MYAGEPRQTESHYFGADDSGDGEGTHKLWCLLLGRDSEMYVFGREPHSLAWLVGRSRPSFAACSFLYSITLSDQHLPGDCLDAATAANHGVGRGHRHLWLVGWKDGGLVPKYTVERGETSG